MFPSHAHAGLRNKRMSLSRLSAETLKDNSQIINPSPFNTRISLEQVGPESMFVRCLHFKVRLVCLLSAFCWQRLSTSRTGSGILNKLAELTVSDSSDSLSQPKKIAILTSGGDSPGLLTLLCGPMCCSRRNVTRRVNRERK